MLFPLVSHFLSDFEYVCDVKIELVDDINNFFQDNSCHYIIQTPLLNTGQVLFDEVAYSRISDIFFFFREFLKNVWAGEFKYKKPVFLIRFFPQPIKNPKPNSSKPSSFLEKANRISREYIHIKGTSFTLALFIELLNTLIYPLVESEEHLTLLKKYHSNLLVTGSLNFTILQDVLKFNAGQPNKHNFDLETLFKVAPVEPKTIEKKIEILHLFQQQRHDITTRLILPYDNFVDLDKSHHSRDIMPIHNILELFYDRLCFYPALMFKNPLLNLNSN